MAAKKDELTPEAPEVTEIVETPAAPVTQPENPAPSLKPTAVASGGELIAETAGAVELASPHMEPPLERVEEAPQSLDVLAAKHRVPAWQAAALNRYMGWEPGKLVSDIDYQSALSGLSARRLGGGRNL